MKSDAVATQLCLKCGLCCNGVLFKDVRLQPGDDAARLRRLGLPVKTTRGRGRFAQPCQALQGDCSCGIYRNRPARCVQFECLLFAAVQEGEMSLAAALKVVKETAAIAHRVRVLLNQLGDADDARALSLRFRRIRRRMETSPPGTPEALEGYAELTLAVHDLNLRLSGAFYP